MTTDLREAAWNAAAVASLAYQQEVMALSHGRTVAVLFPHGANR